MLRDLIIRKIQLISIFHICRIVLGKTEIETQNTIDKIIKWLRPRLTFLLWLKIDDEQNDFSERNESRAVGKFTCKNTEKHGNPVFKCELHQFLYVNDE